MQEGDVACEKLRGADKMMFERLFYPPRYEIFRAIVVRGAFLSEKYGHSGGAIPPDWFLITIF